MHAFNAILLESFKTCLSVLFFFLNEECLLFLVYFFKSIYSAKILFKNFHASLSDIY